MKLNKLVCIKTVVSSKVSLFRKKEKEKEKERKRERKEKGRKEREGRKKNQMSYWVI